MKYNNDFAYDLKIGRLKESELGRILTRKTIELKRDLQAHKTGNVFIEYASRGKPSGIATTKSDYYCFCIRKSFILIGTTSLKKRCRKYIDTELDINGGDLDSSKGILLPITELLR